MRKLRKFQCETCGWTSSEFGNSRRIDKEKLKVAQVELDRHKAETHPDETFKRTPQKFQVMFEEKSGEQEQEKIV